MTRRERTSTDDHATPDRAKLVTDAISQQLRDLAASAGIFQRSVIFKDVACTGSSVIVLRHNFGGPANWLVVRWTPFTSGNPANFSEDPAPEQDGSQFLTLYTPYTGTASVLVF
jgi:hypothetical protein